MGGVLFSNGSQITKKKLLLRGWDERSIDFLIKSENSWKLRRGEISLEKYATHVKDVTNISYSEIKIAFNIWHESYKINKKLFKFINKLNSAISVGIVSGNISERVLYLEKKYQFLSNFNFADFSYEHNIDKNNPLLFKLVKEKNNLTPSETIVIDDKIDCIRAAKKNNFLTYKYESYIKFEMNMSKYGIEI